MAVEYPYGYGEGTKTMAVLRARYEPKMHPEYARRLFAWIESLGGRGRVAQNPIRHQSGFA